MNEPDYTIRYKPVTTAPQTPTESQGRDTFETPNYAVDLLLPFIPACNRVWEPAAGNGKIVNRLHQAGYDIFATDIRSNTEVIDRLWNFVDPHYLTEDYPIELNDFIIITNPPYSIKEKFIDRAMEYGVPWAMLINACYSGMQIKWIAEYGCEKIIPNRRVDFITPTGRTGKTSSSQFHSMWLTHGFNIGRTETFVELSLKDKKEKI